MCVRSTCRSSCRSSPSMPSGVRWSGSRTTGSATRGMEAGAVGADKIGGDADGGHMSVLVVGLSHKSASVATLERAVLTGDTLGKLLRDVFHSDDVAGSLVVSTCNRVEVYAEVDKFHGGLS